MLYLHAIPFVRDLPDGIARIYEIVRQVVQ